MSRVGHARRGRRGATLVLIALLLVVLVGTAAFALEIGRMYTVRSQLQGAVDAGALAANLKLRSNPNDLAGAAAAAKDFVRRNRVGWLVTVPEDAINVEIGKWDADLRTFAVTADGPNAVRVFGRQDDEPLFFGRVFNRSQFTVPRSAVAAAGSQPLDIMMVLDLSGSMGDEGRIDALRNAAPDFVDVIDEMGDDDQIGVMGYGALPSRYDPTRAGHTGTVYTLAPAALKPASDGEWVGVLEAGLTTDFSYLKSSVLTTTGLTPSKYGDGYTPTGAALRDAAHYLDNNARDEVRKIIVLMSDGHANRPNGDGPGYALDMAGYAEGLEIDVYTISLGDDADIDFMTEIADITGAKHFDATGSGVTTLTQKLQDAFREAALAIKRSQLVQ
jgi:Mg-chelatase subunit ChlD